MVTYYEIMGTDLSKLTAAADDWAAMAKDFDKLARTYHHWDRYNWDAGKSTDFPGGVTIPDSEMGRLHKTGLAREFDMRGSSSTYTSDLNSDAGPTVNPPDQGREGTRGDVSRGAEENR
ncbi:hypothetical protein ACFY93_07480 [Streptomyces sp. NPDC008313]|uniref:hypothetical protein n=1 Tax=Streptomyces sp. NPDC008313 TaxID=3364826 RepID=UPI0036E03409